MTLSDRIKECRAAAGMTLEEVAKYVGVTRATIQKYENGVIGNIPSDKIEQLAKALHTTPAHLMGWDVDADLNDYRKRLDLLRSEFDALPDTEYGNKKKEAVKAEISDAERQIRRLEQKKENPPSEENGLKSRLSRLDPDLLKLLADFVALAQANPDTAKRHLSFAVQELQSSAQDQ